MSLQARTSGVRLSFMEFAILLFIAGVPLVAMVALIAGEIVFRRTATGKIWLEIRRLEKRLYASIDRLQETRRNAEATVAAAAKRYERQYVGRLLRRRPIRDLRPYVDVSMSWAALERAGMHNLEQFRAFHGRFEDLRGIGEARGQALRQARRAVDSELAQATLPMPTLGRPDSPGFHTVKVAVQAVKLRTQVHPNVEAIKSRVDALSNQGPGPVALRWAVWTGRSDGLAQALQKRRDRLADGTAQEIANLEEFAQHVTQGKQSTETLMEHYQKTKQSVRQLLERATIRALRNRLRPTGAAAMRAAEGFDNEEDFCDRVLEPLVAALGYDRIREHTIERRIGSRDTILYADFLLLDDQGDKVAVLEAKSRMRTERDIEGARDQGISYALFEELRPVMVAAPEGLWLYERQGQQAVLHRKYTIEEAFEEADSLRAQVDDLADAGVSR